MDIKNVAVVPKLNNFNTPKLFFSAQSSRKIVIPENKKFINTAEIVRTKFDEK